MIHQNQFLNANLHGYTGQHKHMHCNAYVDCVISNITQHQIWYGWTVGEWWIVLDKREADIARRM